MNASQEITLLQQRSAQARIASDHAAMAGSQEQRIAAYCLAEALELQLELQLDRLLVEKAPRHSSKDDCVG